MYILGAQHIVTTQKSRQTKIVSISRDRGNSTLRSVTQPSFFICYSNLSHSIHPLVFPSVFHNSSVMTTCADVTSGVDVGSSADVPPGADPAHGAENASGADVSMSDAVSRDATSGTGSTSSSANPLAHSTPLRGNTPQVTPARIGAVSAVAV